MFTPHSTHDRYHRSCSACRWERKTPEQQATIRAARRAQGITQGAARWERMTPEQQAGYRERGAAAWRRQHPERAARRDAILAGRTPEPCDLCGIDADVHPFVTDYDAGTVVWRCRTCAKANRGEQRAA